MKKTRTYGYEDYHQMRLADDKWNAKRFFAIALAIMFILGLWLWLDQKLIFGESWVSGTYDTVDWRTNEGNLHTFGAWDMEAHIWKTEYILENFPHFNWNPHWYLGMPLLKYYQPGFYMLNILVMYLTSFDAAKSALMMVVFGHLLATLMTFFVCYKVSRRVWVSALASSFLLSNTFISLRSYGWEPITVVFLFLYPLGIHLFLKEPLRPLRFWLIIVLGLAYISHPLIWFSLCMFIGLYLITIALRKNVDESVQKRQELESVLLYFLENAHARFCQLVDLKVLVFGIQATNDAFLDERNYYSSDMRFMYAADFSNFRKYFGSGLKTLEERSSVLAS